MLTLDLPPTTEQYILQTAKTKGITAEQLITDLIKHTQTDSLAYYTGIVPLSTSTHTVTNDFINQLRDEYHV